MFFSFVRLLALIGREGGRDGGREGGGFFVGVNRKGNTSFLTLLMDLVSFPLDFFFRKTYVTLVFLGKRQFSLQISCQFPTWLLLLS